MTVDPKIMIPMIRKVLPTVIAQEIVGVQPMSISTAPETWQSYLRRLGNGLNGLSERSQTVTEEDIVARAEKYMQIKYPGPYRVEQFYNANKMKWDLRLKFEDPKEETLWLLKWS